MRRPLPLLLALCFALSACTVKLGGDDGHTAVGHSPIPNASLVTAGQYRLTRPCAAQLTALRHRALDGLAGMTVQQDVQDTGTWVFAASQGAGTGLTVQFSCGSARTGAAEFLNVDYAYTAPATDRGPGGLPQVFRAFLTEIARQHDAADRASLE